MNQKRFNRFEDWQDRRVDTCLTRLINAAKQERTLRDAFDAELTSHGNGEEKIAKSHEGREIIELIQNARDAIDPDGPGQVYIGVLDEGILVANTGEPFDLLNEDTERAVKMIGESNKTNENDTVDFDSDTVGHIGVGLKSTVAVGDDFEVWSRRSTNSDVLRVRYSRAYITAAILAGFGNELPDDLDIGDSLVGPFADEVEAGLFEPNGEFQHSPQRPPDDLGKAPLFWFPWPLDPSSPGPSNSTLATRSKQLLTEPTATLSQFADPPETPFQTAVFVEYEDKAWRELLEKFDIPTPINFPDDPKGHGDELWEKVAFHGERSEGLDPETLINLGKIQDVYLERISDGTTLHTEHWSVPEPVSEASLPDDQVRHRRFDIEITTETGTSQTLTYDSFSGRWEEAEKTQPQLVIERPRDDAQGTTRDSYPLHLYYPISATTDALPVCVHGRFKVTTERKDLSRSSAAHNRQVLKDCAELIGRLCVSAAQIASNPEAAPHWSRYPWALFPDPVSDTTRVPDDPKDTEDLLNQFRRTIYENLRDEPTIPTAAGPETVDEVTLYPSVTNLAGVAAGRRIRESLVTDKEPAATAPVSVPTETSLEMALKQFDDTTGRSVKPERLKALLGEERAEETLDDWASWLAASLAMKDGTDAANTSTPTHTVPSEDGRALFAGLVELVSETEDETDDSINEILRDDTLAAKLKGVYLLPCQRPGDDTRLDLVPIKPSPSGDIDLGTSSRTVFWGLDRDTLSFSYPPEYGSFEVFFFDEESQRSMAADVLEGAGKARTWGVREYQNNVSVLIEALLGTFGPNERDVTLNHLASLGTLLPELTGDRLKQTELAVGERALFMDAVTSTDQRRLLRLRLRVRRSRLVGEGLSGQSLRDSVLSDEWQRIRERALTEDEEPELADPSADGADLDQGVWSHTAEIMSNAFPNLDTEAWTGLPVERSDLAVRKGLARGLSLLGVSSLPGVRFVALYGDAHPTFDDGNIPPWHPDQWTDNGVKGWIEDHRDDLRDAVESSGYVDWITSFNNHPRKTISHKPSCNDCPTAPDDNNRYAYLPGWTWFDTDQLATLRDHPEMVRRLLARYNSEYQGCLLTTKWCCRRYIGCNSTDATAPTVANVQLRRLPIWDVIVDRSKTVVDEGLWDGYEDQLDCAVIQTGSGSGGQPGWRLFPHVDPGSDDVDLNEERLAELGVVPLGDLDVTGAEYRLQRIQETLADANLPDGVTLSETDEPIRLEVPSKNARNWARAYSQLLRPLLEAWPPADNVSTDENLNRLLTSLTHIPLKQEDTWYTASISWIREHGGDVVWRYQEQNPPQWDRRKLATIDDGNPGYRLEHPVPETGFADFAKEALSVRSLSADEPRLSSEQFKEQQRPLDERVPPGKVERWDWKLKNRLPLLLATIPTRQDEYRQDRLDELMIAIDNIGIVDSLPSEVRKNISDPRSTTYVIPGDSDDAKGIALVADELSEPKLQHLAQGFALLTRQYRNIGTLESMLHEEREYDEIQRRFRGTFPVDECELFIDGQKKKNLRERLELAASLLEAMDASRPSVGNAVAQLESLGNQSDDLFQRVAHEIRTGDSLDEVPGQLRDYIECCRDVNETLRETVARLFEVQDDGVAGFRDHVLNISTPNRRETVLAWLDARVHRLPGALADDDVIACCHRLKTGDAIWIDVESEPEHLQSPGGWHTVFENTNLTVSWDESLPEYASEDGLGEYWIELTKNERATEMASLFKSQLEQEIPEDTAAAVYDYIVNDEELPAESESSSDHKKRAFAAATNYLRENDPSSLAIINSDGLGIDPNPTSTGPRRPGSGGDDGPVSYTGRGELAEVGATIEILDRTSEWLSRDTTDPSDLIEGFKTLHNEQTACGTDEITYQWHTERRWNRELLALLKDDSTRVIEDFANWDSKLQTGTSLTNLSSVALLDVSKEQGPGFDLIDPVSSDGVGLSPRPIELKSVTSTDPPFSIQLTTNEYQQCKHHVSESDHPYVIRLVYVPTNEQTLAATQIISQYEITNESDLEALLDDDPFDMRVRSGYLRIPLE